MAWEDEFQTVSKNPAKYFLEWSSQDKCFSFYNKETKAKVLVKLPFSFVALKQFHSVSGYSKTHGSGIYANEVVQIGTDELTVKTFKGGFSITGVYASVKDRIKAIGGKYCKSIYIMSPKNELLNVQFSGGAVEAWGEFVKANTSEIRQNWLTVSGAEDKVNGTINFSVPVFKLGEKLKTEDIAVIRVKHAEVESYSKGTSVVSEVEKGITVAEDDLPF